MPGSIDNLIPTAKQIQKEAALKEAEKAEQYARLAAAAEAEKRALIERLNRPSGKSEEEKIQLASTVIQRAVRNGMTEVQVYRFPNSLCTDKGRAIIQQEKGWENSLTGIPKEIFQLWTDYLKPRGYRISYQVIDYPGGVPGDIAITIAWGD
jgi:CTP synthase (UTP-ammonia lyase)